MRSIQEGRETQRTMGEEGRRAKNADLAADGRGKAPALQISSRSSFSQPLISQHSGGNAVVLFSFDRPPWLIPLNAFIDTGRKSTDVKRAREAERQRGREGERHNSCKFKKSM